MPAHCSLLQQTTSAVVVAVAESGLIWMCWCKVECWPICRGLGVGVGAFAPHVGGGGQTHCAPGGGWGKRTAPRLGTAPGSAYCAPDGDGGHLLIPSRGSCEGPGVPLAHSQPAWSSDPTRAAEIEAYCAWSPSSAASSTRIARLRELHASLM